MGLPVLDDHSEGKRFKADFPTFEGTAKRRMEL
jgi:hypothetical protein